MAHVPEHKLITESWAEFRDVRLSLRTAYQVVAGEMSKCFEGTKVFGEFNRFIQIMIRYNEVSWSRRTMTDRSNLDLILYHI